MDTNAKIQSVLTIVPAASSMTAGGDFVRERPPAETEKAVQYRLIIEEGPTDGAYVYKTMNSLTGEIIRQFPRDQVLQMRDAGDYTAGGLIDTNA